MKLAIGGQMGSGKDTFYEYLLTKNLNIIKVSFAEPIYSILNFAQETCFFEKVKDRKFLQFVGSEWAREKDPNIWINIVDKKTKEKNDNFCLTDLRFENEFNYLKQNNWILIKIERDIIPFGREGNGSIAHISENALKNINDSEWDFIIKNNSTLENYFKEIDKF